MSNVIRRRHKETLRLYQIKMMSEPIKTLSIDSQEASDALALP